MTVVMDCTHATGVVDVESIARKWNVPKVVDEDGVVQKGRNRRIGVDSRPRTSGGGTTTGGSPEGPRRLPRSYDEDRTGTTRSTSTNRSSASTTKFVQ